MMFRKIKRRVFLWTLKHLRVTVYRVEGRRVLLDATVDFLQTVDRIYGSDGESHFAVEIPFSEQQFIVRFDEIDV